MPLDESVTGNDAATHRSDHDTLHERFNRMDGRALSSAVDPSDTLSSTDRALVTKDVGDPESGWYNLWGSVYCQNATASSIALQYSTNDGSSWSNLDAQGAQHAGSEYMYFQGWIEYDADTGTGLHIRIYFDSEGGSGRFELSGDSRWQAEVNAVGPF